MVGNVKKKTVEKNTFSPEVKSVLRAYILSHKERMVIEDLTDLQMYLEVYHGVKRSVDEIKSMVVHETKDIGIEMKAKHMEEDLFSPSPDGRKIKLGSCFCPMCGIFKNYQKECPHCRDHEMTL